MNITKKISSNRYKGRYGHKPDMIVCHITEGSYQSAVNWLCNPSSQVSAHFIVAKDGRITQLVDLKDGAWCNGTSINSTKNGYYGNSTLKKVRDRKTNANYYTISIEFEGFYKEDKGKLTETQRRVGIELIKHICSEVKKIYGIDIPIDREHIVGHYQVTPITKPNCPGQNFQFDAVINELRKVKNVSKEKTWLQVEGEKAIQRLDKVAYGNEKDMLSSPQKWIDLINDPNLAQEQIKDTSDLLALMFIMLDRVTQQ